MGRGAGVESRQSSRRLGLIVVIHLLWLMMVCFLGAWWGKLVLKQAHRIAELETQLGISQTLAQSQWLHTQRMLLWESVFFFGLLIGCSLLLIWLYYRDLRRARGIQAFFASVTHELRTPLTSIRLQAESIAESEGQKKLVQRLLEDTMRLEAQVERTLELARVEGGGPVYRQPLQIRPWIDRFFKTWVEDYRDRVDYATQVDDVLVEADPSAMQVILKNILENSVKHAKNKKIQIQVSSKIDKKGISLVFRDNGPGYQGDGKNLGRLFQKGPSSQGTGVGLYLVSVLMKRMGGVARFAFDTGFEVTLWFPEGKFNG